MAKISDEKLQELKEYPLSNRIMRLRTISGYTQGEVSKLLGVSQQSICAWETGKRMPYSSMLEKIIELYELPLNYFDDVEIERIKLKKRKD
jgi:DNA-binding XRE family transcriptional regulator